MAKHVSNNETGPTARRIEPILRNSNVPLLVSWTPKRNIILSHAFGCIPSGRVAEGLNHATMP